MGKVFGDESQYKLGFGKTIIPFQLKFRRKRHLSITVFPDRSVVVLAPQNRSVDEALQFVRKRAAWIIKQRNYFQQFHPLPGEKRYVSGETHLYLGRQYRLKVICHNQSGVKLVGKYFYVSVDAPKNINTVKECLDNWYMKRAQQIFHKKLSQCIGLIPSLKLSPKKITIRRMYKRWGSCTKSGNIQLNLDLIRIPLYCIEYVIAHELCHLRVHDHSSDFYRLLSRFMPDWEKRKAKLNSIVFSN